MNAFWSITMFWVLAAGAVALALAFVLPWLMRKSSVAHGQAARRDINLAVYRDQMNDLSAEYANGQLTEAQYLASKLELETRAAEDALAHEDLASAPASSRRLGYGLAVVVPLATISLYAWLGNPNALMEPMAADDLADWDNGGLTPEGLQR
jgi:cytochrome c-type biogenesis protein CcmH